MISFSQLKENKDSFRCPGRDKGPAFLISESGQMLAVDFDFISMFPGMTEETRALVEAKDREWAEMMGLPIPKAKVASEGGARESNGKGILILVEKLEFKRNTHLRNKEMEDAFKKGLNVS